VGGERGGFLDAAKKRKMTESIQEKKFLSARKKLSTQEGGKQKKGVSHVQGASIKMTPVIGFKQIGNHLM